MAEAKHANARGELVVGDDGRHRDKEAGSGGDERLSDAGCNGAQGCGAGSAQAVKRFDHAHDGTEEADERAGCGDRRQPRQAALQAGDCFAGRCLCGALQRRQVARRSRAAGLALVGFVDVLEDLGQRARFEVAGRARRSSCSARALRKVTDRNLALAGGFGKGRPSCRR